MSLLLSGTNGVSDVDGSASTPAVRGTDTNTGIFFPAADTIAFAEGGSEVARFDSSGNLGIGTSSPAAKLDFGVTSLGTNVINIRKNGNYINAIGVDSNGFTRISCPNDAGIAFSQISSSDGTTFTERMRMDTSGNLLVGQTSVYGSEALGVTKNVSGSEVARFYASHSSNPYGLAIVYPNANPNGTANDFLACFSTGFALRMSARSNGGIANYSANNVNLSDAREKTNIELAGSYLDKICAIPVKTFNYIDQNIEEDDGLTLGVVAQDVEAVAPELVKESNWGTEEEPKMRLAIYQTDLQYALMKCIQEQQAIITEQANAITALEARLTALEQA